MVLSMRVFDANTQTILFEMILPSSLQYSYGLNESAHFSCEIPQNWPNAQFLRAGQAVEFRRGKTVFLFGNIQKIDQTLGDTIRLDGLGALDRLYDEKAFTLSLYHKLPLLGVLVELLTEAGWVLGDISSLPDPNKITSIDLRGEPNLLVQINKLLGGFPEVFYREGAKILGVPSLDIGRFSQDSGIRAFMKGPEATIPQDNPDTHWIRELSYSEDVSQVVYAVHAVGGPIKDSLGTDRVVNLGDAAQDDPSLLFNPDFPIIEDLAGQSWATLNYQTFGRVGGVIRSTVDGTEDIPIGDFSSGGVEVNQWVVMTFIPFPGIFDSFRLWFGAITANAIGFDLTWVLQELDPSNFRTVLVDNLATGTINTTNLADSMKRIFVADSFEMQQGKLYGLAIGFDFNPIPDVFNIRIKKKTVSSGTPSRAFRFQTRNGKPTVGQSWTPSVDLGFIEIKTRPIDAPLASFTGETAAKYAPKKTGTASTLVETQATGAALYLWSIAYLQDRIPNVATFNLSATGTDHLPKAGDLIEVRGKAQGQYRDPLTGEIFHLQRKVEENLRLDKAQIEMDGDTIQVRYDLLNGIGVPRTGLIVDLYNKAKNERPNEGDVAARPWALLLDTLTSSVGPVSPNSLMQDGTAAYRVSLSIFSGLYPSRPANTETVYLAGLPFGSLAGGGTLRVELVSFPDLDSGLLVFDIALSNRAWVYGDIADLVVKLIWR